MTRGCGRGVAALVLVAAVATATGAWADEFPVPSEAELLGTWTVGNHEASFEQELSKDHRFSMKVRRTSGRVSRFAGTWSYKDGLLVMRGDDEEGTVDLRMRRITANLLDQIDGEGDKASLRRWMRVAPDAPRPMNLAGTWVSRSHGRNWRWELSSEGTFVFQRDAERLEGSWRQAAAGLFFRIDDKVPMDFLIRVLDKDHFEATYDSVTGRTFAWERQGEAPAEADLGAGSEYVGRWVFGTQTAKVVYDLAKDGTYVQEWIEKGRTSTSRGTWTVEGFVLSLTGPSGKPLRLGTEWVTQHYLDTYPAGQERIPRMRWVRPTEDIPEAPDYVGTWVTQGPDIGWKLEIQKTGVYRLIKGKEQTAQVVTGKWTGAPACIFFTAEGEEDSDVLNVRYMGPDHFSFQADVFDSRRIVWGREGSKPPTRVPVEPTRPTRRTPDKKKAREPTSADLVGKWFVKDEKLSVHITLNEDGTFVHILTSKSGEERTRGTWKLEKDTLVADPENEDAIYRLKWRLIDINRLMLIDEGENETTVLQREGTQPTRLDLGRLTAEAKTMVGEWLARGEGLEVRLSLRADGTFTQVMTKGEESATTTGQFNVKGGQLLALPVDEIAVTKLRVRLIDNDTLEIVDAEGGTSRLVRQGD